MNDEAFYPENWPRCPSCGDYALDGHITCGSADCGTEASWRDGDAMDTEEQ